MPKMSEVGWRVDTDSRGSKKRDGARCTCLHCQFAQATCIG